MRWTACCWREARGTLQQLTRRLTLKASTTASSAKMLSQTSFATALKIFTKKVTKDSKADI